MMTPIASLKRGDVIQHDGTYMRVDAVTIARDSSFIYRLDTMEGMTYHCPPNTLIDVVQIHT